MVQWHFSFSKDFCVKFIFVLALVNLCAVNTHVHVGIYSGAMVDV